MNTKLTVRMPRKLLENAKRYAKANQTTLTELIAAYLEHIPGEPDALQNAPIVRRLSGSLSAEMSVDDTKNIWKKSMASAKLNLRL